MKKLTISEKVNCPLIWLSPNYYDYALQGIERAWIDDEISTSKADWLKTIVFINIFKYYILFFPIYTVIMLLIIVMGILFQILYFATFRKFQIIAEIYTFIYTKYMSFEWFVLDREYKAGYINLVQYNTAKQKIGDIIQKDLKKFRE
ncbi:MAG: hypothetical protein WD512_00060 [Candidatus Paceibacterota bacterium]